MSTAPPDGHLFALAEAWPLISDAALSGATVELARTPELLLDRATQSLADALENELRSRAAGSSLAVLGALRDHAWFGEASIGGCSLLDLLFRVAKRTIEPHGDRAVLRRDGNFCTRLEQYRWVSLLLPADLLIAARYAQEIDLEPASDSISLLSPILTAVLGEAPVAETHLHLGAAVPFELLWTGLVGWLRTRESEGLSGSLPRQATPPPFGSADAFHSMLVCAGIGRLVMARFLSATRRVEQVTFVDFWRSYGAEIARARPPASGVACDDFSLFSALRALFTGTPITGTSLSAVSNLYRTLAGPSTEGAPDDPASLIERDPLTRYQGAQRSRALPETRFLTRSLSYLRSSSMGDASFERLFWQYVRVRNKLFGYLVPAPGTPGLDWFTRHYERIRPFRQVCKKLSLTASLEAAGRDVRLGSLEGRTAPESQWADVRDELKGHARQAHGHRAAAGMPRPEVGIIFHFIKEAEGKSSGRRFLHADPRQTVQTMRFGAWSAARLKEASAISEALRHHPELLILLRGVDVAATELSVPTWPLLPIFHLVREASSKAANVLARRFPSVRAVPIRATCHAGEEYRRLAEGLRRVHELIEADILHAGDRIGHGLSLGDSPDEWARRAPVVRQPKEERLDDLLWEVDRAAKGDFECAAHRLAFARGDAHQLAREIYGANVHVDDLRHARRLRHDLATLDRLGFPSPKPALHAAQFDEPAQKLLVAYLTDGDVFEKGRVPVDVEVTPAEVQFLYSAQAWLRRELAAREITVEGNPSSNLLVGDLRDMRTHPSFRLQPLPGTPSSDQASLPLSINADDPVCFATTLPDEYAYLYAAMLRAGVGSAGALEWLRARRDDGFRSRFTLATSAVPDELHRIWKGLDAGLPRVTRRSTRRPGG